MATDPIPTEQTSSPQSKWDDSEFHQQLQQSWFQRHPRETWALGGLLLVLLFVIYALPVLVSTSNPTDNDTTPITTANDRQTQPVMAESPWQDAQLAKARRAAQDILAQLLDRQKKLESMQVQRWAADDFNQAMTTANQADQLYRQRQFEQAQQLYQKTLNHFDELTTRADTLFQQALIDGTNAIDQQQPQAAIAAFDLATAIRPDSEDANQGLTRAQSLEQVIVHLENADNLRLQQDLNGAKEEITKALAIDNESKAARALAQQLDQAILERDYSSAMGRGFDGLYQKKYAAAIKNFRQALALKPNDNSAQQAITQAENQQTQASIQSLLNRASTLETQEQWRAAHNTYEQAQQLDSSLVQARIGAIRSKARAQLDEEITTAIGEPLRLADPAVYRQSQQLLQDAQSVKPQGKKIRQQIEQLQQAMSLSQQTIAVRLRSDNATQVTLYKVGELGSFETQELQLKPGRYTAVGNRQGYRDVREEFTVSPTQNNQTIVIQCIEKISLEG